PGRAVRGRRVGDELRRGGRGPEDLGEGAAGPRQEREDRPARAVVAGRARQVRRRAPDPRARDHQELRQARRDAAHRHGRGAEEPRPHEGRHGGLLRLMSKSRRASPTRGLRPPAPAPKAAPKRPAFDSLRVAAEIVASLADAVVVTGTDRRVLTANRAAAELFGRPLDDLPGTAIDDVVASSEREHVAEREQRAFRGEEQHYETKVVRANGEERVVAVSTTPLVLEGELLGAVATLRDITEQQRAQDTLARSEARYRNLFESASDAIVTLDANGRFTTFNHAAEIISGYRREELVGQWCSPMTSSPRRWPISRRRSPARPGCSKPTSIAKTATSGRSRSPTRRRSWTRRCCASSATSPTRRCCRSSSSSRRRCPPSGSSCPAWRTSLTTRWPASRRSRSCCSARSGSRRISGRRRK